MQDSLTAIICAINSKYIHSSLAPWCLLAGVESYCENEISAEVAEGTINEDINNVVQRIVNQRPRVIGLCCYIWNITFVTKLIPLIKDRLPNSIIILGGPEVSYHAEEVLKQQPMVQYIISGEGEKPFALLLNALYNEQKPQTIAKIPGVCCRIGDAISVASPYTPQEEPPSPYTKKYFESLKGRIAYLETSRGCPYSCAFCLSGRCGNARFYNMERAKKELLLLANSGTKTVKLVDRTFNANRKRAVELFRFIIQNYGGDIPKGVCFHFEIAGDILDDNTISLLQTAPVGSIQLEIGLQSFNDKTLDAVNRKTNMERLKNNIRRVIMCANMHIHIDLIAGLPYEDWNSFEDSFNIAYTLKPNMLQLGFLKLLYGAPMREYPEQFPCRYSKQAPYEVIETPWMSEQKLKQLHYVEDALERLYNSGRFRRTLDYVLSQSGVTPFQLFYEFGKYSARYKGKGTYRITLDDYTALVYEYFSKQDGINAIVLRDIMACDRVATNASGRLPAVLCRKDDALKSKLKKLKTNSETCPIKGVKRGAALLCSENCIVYADYQNKNPVTGEYMLRKISI